MEKKVVKLNEQELKSIVNEAVKQCLNEYYVRIDRKEDAKILKNCHISIYADDRSGFTPHCHVFTHDGTTEIEISLINWSVVNVKCEGKLSVKKLYDNFVNWLNIDINHKIEIYGQWDRYNENNTLNAFVTNKKIDINGLDPVLVEYLK